MRAFGRRRAFCAEHRELWGAAVPARAPAGPGPPAWQGRPAPQPWPGREACNPLPSRQARAGAPGAPGGCGALGGIWTRVSAV